MEGLELRKAVLLAAGWTVVGEDASAWISPPQMVYLLNDPNGEEYGSVCNTPAECWQYAPAVESSVDVALKYLTLDANYWWNLESPIVSHAKQDYLAVIQSWHGDEDYYGVEVKWSDAMCRAFLDYKQRG